jgi:hypothetical protein
MRLSAVRATLGRGLLAPEFVGCSLRVGVNELAHAVAGDALAEQVLTGLAEGWLVAPRSFSPALPAPPLSVLIPELVARNV